MSIIKKVNGFKPAWGDNCFFAENSVVVGDVVLGKDCSVWFSAVIRGDVNKIVIGDACNIQDGAVVHCTYESADTWIGNNVTVGHNAIVHGCKVEDNVLIGMGAIIMDKAIVKSHSVIAAGSVVLEGTIVESGSIYAGIPAKKVKTLEESQKDLIQESARRYTKYASWYTSD